MHKKPADVRSVGFFDRLILSHRRAGSHEVRELIGIDRVTQHGEHPIVFLLLGILPWRSQRGEARVDEGAP
jgi:hypothetical protein